MGLEVYVIEKLEARIDALQRKIDILEQSIRDAMNLAESAAPYKEFREIIEEIHEPARDPQFWA